MTDSEARDLAEIQQKIYRYGWHIDHREFDALDAIFTDDAFVNYDVPGGTALPWAEMKSWLPGGLQSFRVTQHNMSNPIVEFDGADRARSTTYGHLIHVQHLLDDTSEVMTHYTIYRDEWVRQADGWRIARRTLSNLYMNGPVLDQRKLHLYPKPVPY